MNYCENCSCATNDSRCPLCGSKKLRPVKDDDYCLVTECKKSQAAQRKEDLARYGIHAIGVPFGDGFRSQLALPLENERLYVPYAQLHKTLELLHSWKKEEEKSLRTYLLQHAKSLSISPKLAKRLIRKLRLTEEELIPYLQEALISTDKVYDGGALSNSSAHLYICQLPKYVITLNSETMEIVAVDRR